MLFSPQGGPLLRAALLRFPSVLVVAARIRREFTGTFRPTRWWVAAKWDEVGGEMR